jgi:GNAT superfamily N-acetyltransferase
MPGAYDRAMVEAVLRLATPADADAIEGLMRDSIREIFPAFYDERQTASAVVHVGHLDRMLVDDRTYFVIEEDPGDLIACGGWSRRDRLYAGSGDHPEDARLLDPRTEPARVRAMFTRGDRTRRGLGTRILDACEDAARAEGFRTLSLMATLPGIPLYERFGFAVIEHTTITTPDGVELACASMARPVRVQTPGT